MRWCPRSGKCFRSSVRRALLPPVDCQPSLCLHSSDMFATVTMALGSGGPLYPVLWFKVSAFLSLLMDVSGILDFGTRLVHLQLFFVCFVFSYFKSMWVLYEYLAEY